MTSDQNPESETITTSKMVVAGSVHGPGDVSASIGTLRVRESLLPAGVENLEEQAKGAFKDRVDIKGPIQGEGHVDLRIDTVELVE